MKGAIINELIRPDAEEFVAAAERALRVIVPRRISRLRLWTPAIDSLAVWAGPFASAAGVEWARGETPQELAVFSIAKIKTLMPVVRARQVGARHHRLGFARLKGESGRALRLNDGRDRGLAIHLDNGQQLRAGRPHFQPSDIFPRRSTRHRQAKMRHGPVASAHLGRPRKSKHAFALKDFRVSLRFHHQGLSVGRLQFELDWVEGPEDTDMDRCCDCECEHE